MLVFEFCYHLQKMSALFTVEFSPGAIILMWLEVFSSSKFWCIVLNDKAHCFLQDVKHCVHKYGLRFIVSFLSFPLLLEDGLFSVCFATVIFSVMFKAPGMPAKVNQVWGLKLLLGFFWSPGELKSWSSQRAAVVESAVSLSESRVLTQRPGVHVWKCPQGRCPCEYGVGVTCFTKMLWVVVRLENVGLKLSIHHPVQNYADQVGESL